MGDNNNGSAFETEAVGAKQLDAAVQAAGNVKSVAIVYKGKTLLRQGIMGRVQTVELGPIGMINLKPQPLNRRAWHYQYVCPNIQPGKNIDFHVIFMQMITLREKLTLAHSSGQVACGAVP